MESWFRSGPLAALEVSASGVAGVGVARRRARLGVKTSATADLPAGAVRPALAAPNLADRAVLVRAMKTVIERIGKPRQVALVVPDLVAKVSIVRFDQVPARASDFEQMVRWQVKKSVPFPIDAARVAWTSGVALPDGGREVTVVVARADIVEEYEGACVAAGSQPGLVDLATLNVANLVLASDGASGQGALQSDWMIVNAGATSSTVAMMRGDRLLYFRARPSEGDLPLPDVAHQTVMYCQDRLGGSAPERVVLGGWPAGDPAPLQRLREGLSERLGCRVEMIDPSRTVDFAGNALGAESPLALAAAIGVLARS